MKAAITTLVFVTTMSLSSYSFSQTANYQSDKNNLCSWNSETQTKNLCREVSNDVQIEISQKENRVSITTDGNVAEFHIENWTQLGNALVMINLISADGTSWEMGHELQNNKIWMDLVDEKLSESITYLYH